MDEQEPTNPPPPVAQMSDMATSIAVPEKRKAGAVQDQDEPGKKRALTPARCPVPGLSLAALSVEDPSSSQNPPSNKVAGNDEESSDEESSEDDDDPPVGCCVPCSMEYATDPSLQWLCNFGADECVTCIRKGIPCQPFPKEWMGLLRKVQVAASVVTDASSDATTEQLEELQSKLDALQTDITNMLELPTDVSSAVAMIRGKGPALSRVQVQCIALVCESIEDIDKIISPNIEALKNTLSPRMEVYARVAKYGTIDGLDKELHLQAIEDNYNAIDKEIVQFLKDACGVMHGVMRGAIHNLGKEVLRDMSLIQETDKEALLLHTKHLCKIIDDHGKRLLQENKDLYYALINSPVGGGTSTTL
ncbi:hypothetical protein VF21_04025 [Pseudogymnoascus sp. 05NY08]|nr:hypothetical protein VF21_04025 [Pseudogymnoascus sp. 05NY08]